MVLQKVYVFTKSVFEETEVLNVVGRKQPWVGKQGFRLYWGKCPRGFRPKHRSHQKLPLAELVTLACSERTLANPALSSRGAQPSESGWSLPALTSPRPPQECCLFPFVSYLPVSAVCLTALWGAGTLSLILWHFFWRWITWWATWKSLSWGRHLERNVGK